MVKELKELLKKEAEQQGKEFEFEWATTLSHLGYRFKDAMEKLREAGISIVLTEEEKEQTFKEIRRAYKEGEMWYEGPINTKKFDNISDIIMVHKTDYPPKGEKIHSRYSGDVLDNCKITLGGVEYPFTSKSGRDTVHLSANHEVSPNNGGSWSKKKYAVIIPFKDLKKFSAIKNSVSVDTYTRGPVTLTENCYILCPKAEIAAIQADNPKATVIGYEGEYVQNYANMLIAELGYKLELAHDHDFVDSKQAKRYCEIMKKEGITGITHAHSADKHREVVLGKIYKIVSIIKLIRDERITEKVDKNQLIEDLNSYDFANSIKSILTYETREGKDRLIAQYRNAGTSESIIQALVLDDGEKHADVLIEELRKIGIEISAKILEDIREKDVPEDITIIGYILDNIQPQRTNRDIIKTSIQEGVTSSEIENIEKTTTEKNQKKGSNQIGE